MDTPKVTIRDVASRANVSTSAVSIFLNEKPGLADETRQRIADAIATLGYAPRRSRARPQNPKFVTLLIEKLRLSALSDIFYGDVIEGIESRASRLGYSLALKVVEADGEVPRLLSDPADNLSGIVFLGSGDVGVSLISTVLEQGIPAVLVDNHLPHVAIDSVVPDYVSGGFAATRYLLERRRELIAFIRGPTKYRSLSERFYGYCSALLEAEVGVDQKLVQPYLSQGTPNKGYREMKSLLEKGEAFDAVFCASDRTAFGALQALQEAGISVPDQVSVVGFDNVAQASHTTPALTTVDVPRQKMGELAIQRLHEVITGQAIETPVKLLLPTALVPRES